MATSGEIRRPPVGTFDGRPRGQSHGRRHPTARSSGLFDPKGLLNPGKKIVDVGCA